MDVVARLRAAGCVFAEDEAAILVADRPDSLALEARVRRREAGEPIEYIVGWAEFCGLRLLIEPGVFVPRARTELLAREAIRRAQTIEQPLVLDLCCGSGAIGAAIANAVPSARLVLADRDEQAIRCATRNLGPRADVFCGDLFSALPPSWKGTIDVLTANVPYVPSDSIGLLPPEARLFEPLAALDGGPDGLDLFRRVVAGAPEWLAPGGWLLSETSVRQARFALDLLEGAGLIASVIGDEDREATVVVGRQENGGARRTTKREVVHAGND